MPLSRLYAIVSTSPWRTVTLGPTACDTSVSAAVAPTRRAMSSTCPAMRFSVSVDTGKDPASCAVRGGAAASVAVGGGGVMTCRRKQNARPARSFPKGLEAWAMIANEFLTSIPMPAPDRFHADRLPPRDTAGADEVQAPSKTRRKKDMQALQDLGERLVELDASKLAALGLPE